MRRTIILSFQYFNLLFAKLFWSSHIHIAGISIIRPIPNFVNLKHVFSGWDISNIYFYFPF